MPYGPEKSKHELRLKEGREKIPALVFLGSKVRARPTLVGQQIYLD